MKNNIKRPIAVIDIGFGDNAKGLVTSTLASTYNKANSIVARFSGGVQAAHRVCIESPPFDHVFSSICSGVAYGIDSYWSKYCPVHIPTLVFEYTKVVSKLKHSNFFCYIDGKSPVTTSLDININKCDPMDLSHGTCGWGVGTTIAREEKFVSLLFEDIFNETVCKLKLELIYDHYDYEYFVNNNVILSKEAFIENEMMYINNLKDISNIKMVYKIPSKYKNIIFEGSQGLLLDQHYGFFPHVTRTNTGTTNILEMGYKPELYLVTRAYQTRHGNGPMTNLDITPKDYVNLPENECNVNNKYQGEFRTSILDLDLLKYSINKDDYIRKYKDKATLIITCLDHLKTYKYTLNGKTHVVDDKEDFIREIRYHLKIWNVMINETEFSGHLKQMEF